LVCFAAAVRLLWSGNLKVFLFKRPKARNDIQAEGTFFIPEAKLQA
jgi:hypothetical protein